MKLIFNLINEVLIINVFFSIDSCNPRLQEIDPLWALPAGEAAFKNRQTSFPSDER